MSVFADLDGILRACPTEYLAEQYGPDATAEGIAERLVEGIRAVALDDAASWFAPHGAGLLRADQVSMVLRRTAGTEDAPAAVDPDGSRLQVRPSLGTQIPCSAVGCSLGEWSSKAKERGWVRRGDGWLCVQCADAADERAEIVARIDAGTWGAPALSYRAQQLLAHIQADPGTRWQTGRAEQVYAELGYPKRGRRHNARSDLHELAARDLLTVHGPDDGRFFLLAQPKEGGR
ncbi:hypothetical protein ACFXAY_01235 [Streptomyces microflavus]|uniref:hypothetical protein n=1 Tax=Streptomyces microflavus TaxID=1919 RepID=UPI0036C578FC